MSPLKVVSSLTLAVSTIFFAGCQQMTALTKKLPPPQIILEEYTDTAFKFYCNQETIIRVSYHPLQQNQRTMSMVVKGHTFPMYAVGDPNLLQFITEQGIIPNQGMFWQQIGNKAQLRLLDSTDIEDPTKAPLMFQCQTTSLAASLETAQAVEHLEENAPEIPALEITANEHANTIPNDEYIDPGEPARLPDEIKDMDSEPSNPDLGQILNQF